MGKKLTTEEFIKRAKAVHGEKYDYSKTVYQKSNKKVCIICPEHGEFWQVPASHINGIGCPVCGRKTMTDEQFISEAKKIHGDKYIYEKIGVKNEKGQRCIICPTHGEFWQYKCDHLSRKRGCPKCGGSERLTTDEFIKRARIIHGDKYDYSKVNYVSSHKKVCIICPKHGEFWQEPDNHLRWGCNKCKESSLEQEIRSALNESGIQFEEQKTFDWLKDKGLLKIDFYIPSKNAAIECQGEQHFETFRFEKNDERLSLRKSRDAKKKHLCEEHGIKIIYYVKKEEYANMIENSYTNKDELISSLL